jgi:hypothetical protein
VPAKKNPLNLNALQLKTLTLLQVMAEFPEYTRPGEDAGNVIVNPANPHGDHFHLGDAVVAVRDASGLRNPGVWLALERKGLIRSMYPSGAVLTPLGRDYQTGLRDVILHRSSR